MTIVTSYLEQDKQGLIASEEGEEWKRKVELLGLEGQKELTADTKSPIPFRRIDGGMERVIECFCPSKEPVEKYSKEALPLEVLALVALAKHEEYFNKGMFVYFSPGKPDPFIVGRHNGETYLVAQWGPERLSWDELRERAIIMYKEKIGHDLREAIENAQGQLRSLDSLAAKYFRGEWIHIVG